MEPIKEETLDIAETGLEQIGQDGDEGQDTRTRLSSK
jgi:hypothetical protein